MNRRNYLLFALSCTGLLAACALAPPAARLHLHFILSQMLHGVSDGKTLFLLVFLLVFFLRLALVHGDQPGQSKRLVGLFFVAAAAGLGGALASCLCYLRTYDLPLDWHSYHWRDGINSVNHITHIHTSKSALAWAIELMGQRVLHERFDTGAAYLEAVPRGLSTAIGVLAAATVTLGLAAAPRILRPYPRRQASWVALVLGLATATVSKSILDGGPLAYDAVAGLLAISLLARAGSVDMLFALVARRAILLLLIVTLWATIVFALDPGVLLFQLGNLLYRLAVYGLLLAIARARTAERANRGDWARLAICAGTGCVFAALNIRTELLPLWRAAPATAVRYEFPAEEPNGPAMSLDSFTVASIVDVRPGDSFLQVYSQLGDNPQRVRRVSAAPRSSQPTGFYVDLIILSTSTHMQDLRPTSIMRIRRADVVPAGEHPRLRLQVEFSAALGPVLYAPGSSGNDQIAENERFMGYILLDRYLARVGVSEYVMIPLAQYVCK